MAKELNIPTTGMTDAHPMNVKENQYPLMLNGNILTDISSAVTLTNEHSNILCSKFPTGYKVIGKLFSSAENITYIFLVDPVNNLSQIGYLSDYKFKDFNDFPITNPCTSCSELKEEDIPLELRAQEETCVYTAIATLSGCKDASVDCLGFDIDFPIKSAIVKKDNCGITLYFTDNKNPLRFLKMNEDHTLHNDQRSIASYSGDCDSACDEIGPDCECVSQPLVNCTCCSPNYCVNPTLVNCDKMRLFPLVNHICIEPKSIVQGGSLQAGTYQLAVCYATSDGQRATRTFSCSNPVSVFDPNQTLTEQLDYPTDLAIKFLIEDIDNTKYSYIDIFVVGTINLVSSVKQYSTVDITKLKGGTLEYVVSNFEKGKDVSIDDVFQQFPTYETAAIGTTSGNTLLWGDLKGPRDLNLQRAVNEISKTVNWQTIEADESFYANGAVDANFRSYLRDEVYPFAIVFERNNTQDTCAYPLIGRESIPTDLDVVTNAKDLIPNKECPSVTPNLEWQVYNTGTEDPTPICDYSSNDVLCTQIVQSVICSSYLFSYTVIGYTVVGGTISVGDTITNGTGGSGDVKYVQISAVVGVQSVLYIDITAGSFAIGDTIDNGAGGTGTVTQVTVGDIVPNDCYISKPTIALGPCSDNYPTAIHDPVIDFGTAWNIAYPYLIGEVVLYLGNYYIALNNNTGSTPPSVDWELYTGAICAPNAEIAGLCGSPNTDVRSQIDAADPLLPRLCVDSTLINYPSDISVPYAQLVSSTPVLKISAETITASVYDSAALTAIAAGIPDAQNPSTLLGQPGPFLYPGIQDPPNVTNRIQSNSANLIITNNGQCPNYASPEVAPVMYFFGNDYPVIAVNAFCYGAGCPPPGEDCQGPAIALGGNDFNVPTTQEYWLTFQALAITQVAKFKAFVRDGAYAAGTFPAGAFTMELYDSVGGSVVTTDVSDTDGAIVKVLGDVVNGDTPLVIGNTYWIRVYLTVAPDSGLPEALVNLSTAIQTPDGDWNCDNPNTLILFNYAWANICVNVEQPSSTQLVDIPAYYSLECNYNIYYRVLQVPDVACDYRNYKKGGFAFWESENKTYPNNEEVWGDLCGKPIRHFKFPDCLVSPIQDSNPLGTQPEWGRRVKIYPIGINVNTEDVKTWLDWATTLASAGADGKPLMTVEERDSITGYKIVRGNRVGNKSIIAKGLLYDMWRYNKYDYSDGSTSSINTYYPSYPFNDLREDRFLTIGEPLFYNGITSNPFKHPNSGASNDKFSFLSPETTFNAPTIGGELKFESVVYGDAQGNFYTTRDHAKYVLLTKGGIALVQTLTILNVIADIMIIIGDILKTTQFGLVNSVGFIASLVLQGVGEGLLAVGKYLQYAQQWQELIINFGVPKNFAKYYAAIGNYHSVDDVDNTNNKRRAINNYSYLLAGNYSLTEFGNTININNYNREDSVYISINDTVAYAGTALTGATADTSRFLMSDPQGGGSCVTSDRLSKVASYYSAVKNYNPDQYGDIHDIEWLYTGTCRSIIWDDVQEDECSPIFGGDTFISRMTQKRKFPFFTDTAVGILGSSDFQYRLLSNITTSSFYFNSIGERAANAGAVQFIRVEANFDCGSDKGLYANGTMYTASYGITSFICESDFNLNFRYTTDTKDRAFYPYQSDIEAWTQEYRVPIAIPNYYLYNRTYGKQNKENFFCTQPAIYSNEDCITTYQNRVINSLPDSDSDFFTDSWRTYLANDYHDFPLINGQLVGIDGIEREKVLLRFDNTSLVFNAFYTMTTDAGVAQIGTGSMFAQKPLEYAKTDIGYGGTQHVAFTSTQFGHFWVDARRSAVFQLPAGEGGIEEISQGYNTFFNNNLPFYILKAFPDFPVDNNYKDIGITLVWDNKFDRLFLTKLDYQLRPEYTAKVFSDTTNYVIDDVVFYNNVIYVCIANNTGLNPETNPRSWEVITLQESEYFCNKSWTMAYSPATKGWISFYSFVPNYYVGHENYFQSGINYPQDGDTNKIGIWNHLITNKSYQVFYGTLYPYITDVIVKEQFVNKQLQSIEYQTDFLRFQNDYDYFYNPRVTFNKAIIWSENQNSGNLELVPQVQNNMAQGLLYPRTNLNSTSILVTRKENNWRFNQFSDLVANKYNDVPPMILGCHPYLKEVNPGAILYKKPTFQKQQLTSDYFALRLINDQYSNYKIINKWFVNNTIKSYT